MIPLDYKKALLKAMNYCAYQERCVSELEEKCYQWKLSKAVSKRLIQELMDENYLNEQRFCVSYVRGKIKSNKWGRTKIRMGLLFKRIPEDIIDLGFSSIDEELYENNLKYLLNKKSVSLNSLEKYERNAKIKQYLYGKGYEIELINKHLKLL